MPDPIPETPLVLAPHGGDGLATPPASVVFPAEPVQAVPEAGILIARPASRRFRLWRAYGAALRVALSYGGFKMVAWVRGPRWAARNRVRLHLRNGRRVRRAILRLRGLFIKAGQLASALTNFLPEPFRDELEGLQDQVPANSFDLVRARLAEELGTRIRLGKAATRAPRSLAGI